MTGDKKPGAFINKMNELALETREGRGFATAPKETNLVASTGPIPTDAIPQQSVSIGGEAVPTQQQAAPGMPMAPQAAGGGYDQVFQQMHGAAKQKSQAEQQYYATQKAAQDEANARNIEIDNFRAQEMAGLEKQQTELANGIMSQKIDPNRLWANASTGSKVSAAIGMILGGLGAGLTGGPNQALAVINRLVDQDIDAQKTELGKKQTLYSMNLQKTKDANLAYTMTKAQMAAGLQGKLASAAAMLGSQQAKAAEAQASSQINMYRQQLNAQVAEQQTQRAVIAHMKATGSVDYSDFIKDPKMREDVMGRAVPGIGLANTKEAAQKANELVTTTKAGVGLLRELRGFAEKTGSKFSLEDRAKAETLARMIMGQIREGVLGPGTVNEGERKILEKMVKDPTSITQLPSTAIKSLDTIIDTLENKQRIGLTQYGLKPAPKIKETKR